MFDIIFKILLYCKEVCSSIGKWEVLVPKRGSGPGFLALNWAFIRVRKTTLLRLHPVNWGKKNQFLKLKGLDNLTEQVA